jgi:hypothetical protein
MKQVTHIAPGVGRPPARPILHVRRSVWHLTSLDAPWDPVTEALARGVRVMQSRPATDPTSWAFQAAVHATRRTVPAGVPWNQRRHGDWFFLPWNRMYVYFFERILRAAVAEAGGPRDFALPYWDCDRPAPGNTLPPPLREPQLPDGTPNPLFLPAPLRSPGVVAGGGLPPAATSAAAALARTRFVGAAAPGFGSGRFGRRAGVLERGPHDAIHVLLGGRNDGACRRGLMSDPACAALDPVFWLHHANVDRLWDQWLAQGGRADPAAPAWLDRPFSFHDETGAPITLTAADVVDAAGRLGYRYGVEDPAGPVHRGAAAPMGRPADTRPAGTRPVVARAVVARSSVRGNGDGARPPGLVATSAREVVLVGDPTSVPLTAPPSARAQAGPDRYAEGRTILLEVGDIEAERNPGVVYAVYVNLPASPSADDRARHHAGNVSLFGVEARHDRRRRRRRHPDVRHTFDVTHLVADLRATGDWDPDAIRVAFEPIGLLPPQGTAGDVDAFRGAPADSATTAARPVRIGRVSLFVV